MPRLLSGIVATVVLTAQYLTTLLVLEELYMHDRMAVTNLLCPQYSTIFALDDCSANILELLCDNNFYYVLYMQAALLEGGFLTAVLPNCVIFKKTGSHLLYKDHAHGWQILAIQP